MRILFLGLHLAAVAQAGAHEGSIARLPPIGSQLTAAFRSAPAETWPAVLKFLQLPTDRHDATAYKSLDAAFQPNAQPRAPLPALQYVPALRDFSVAIHEGEPVTLFDAQQKLYTLSTYIPALIPGWQIVSSQNEALQTNNSDHARILMASAQRMAAAWQTNQVLEEVPARFFINYPNAQRLPGIDLDLNYRSQTGFERFRLAYAPWLLAADHPLLEVLGPLSLEYGPKHVRGVQLSDAYFDIGLLGAPGDPNRYDDGPTLRIIRDDGRIEILPSRSNGVSGTPKKPRRSLPAWLRRLDELTDWSSLEFETAPWPKRDKLDP